MSNRRRKQVDSSKRKRRTVLLTLGLLVIVCLFLTLIFGENGLVGFMKLRAVRAELHADIAGIEKENEELTNQIDMLKNDPNLLEDLARQYGLTREGELIFKFEYEDEE